MSDRVVRRNENMPPIAVSQAKEFVSTASERFIKAEKNMAFLRRKATCDYSDKKNFRGKFKKTLEKTRQNKKNVL